MARSTAPFWSPFRALLTIAGYSRHDATPRRLVIELTPDGTDYCSHGDVREDDGSRNQALLQSLLATAGAALTRREIAERWPRDRQRPDAATLWRWLEQVVGDGLVERQGGGRRGDPLRFRLGPDQQAER